VRRIQGVIQHYAWGDPTFIPELLGIEPDGRPCAELWLGTHPNGPSRFTDGTPLSEITGDLPYLLKVLAVADPLSLQTHPGAAHAADGFARGIYADPNPKPELLCAMTPFRALCGFRPAEPTIELLHELGIGDLSTVVSCDGPGSALHGLYRGTLDPDPIIAACARSQRPEAQLVTTLAKRYHAEPSVAATLLLNLVELRPGEALRLDAGNLHAYLEGAGIELMGASDNVVRGGLTSKPVDVDELLRVVDPSPLADPVLPTGTTYALPAIGMELRRLDAGAAHTARGHELAIGTSGGAWYVAPGDTLRADVVTFVVAPID